MQKFLVILVSFLLLNSFSTNKDNRIPWQEGKKLSWADFKGTPDSTAPFAAITASGLYYESSGRIENGKVSHTTKVICYFHPSDSWYKKELATENLLAHEQLHFDISELYARKLRKAIKDFSFTKDMQKEMEGLYHRTNANMKKRQSQYDQEANFSLDKEQQRAWGAKIKKELLSLADYR